MLLDKIDKETLKQERRAEAKIIDDMLDELDALQVAKTQGPQRLIGAAVSSTILILQESGLLLPIIRRIVSMLFFIKERHRRAILNFLDTVEIYLPSPDEYDMSEEPTRTSGVPTTTSGPKVPLPPLS